MRVFVAGGSGAVGRQLLPQLVAHGHEVTATTSSPARQRELRELGAAPVVVDGLDGAAVGEAVARAEPEAVIHQMTALSGLKGFKKFDDDFAVTNRLRTEGTRHLLAAAQASGARRFIAQSYGNWNYQRTGSGLKAETDPLDPSPPAYQAKSLAAIRELEQLTAGAKGIDGIAVRYGNLYGPGTSIAVDGLIIELVRKRRFPIVGDGTGVWSWTHVDDAASAAVAALDHGAPGVYNICDDDPAPVADWLPFLAQAVGARPPRRVPVWMGRLAAGEVGVSMMTQIRGASNARAKRELGWRPAWPSWRQGFRDGLAAAAPARASA